MIASRPALLLLLVSCLLLGSSAAEGQGRTLREKIHDSKYRWGDYGVYFGWHEPADWQFDVHGSAAFPFGVKVRLEWYEWLRIEADISYMRRSSEPPSVSSIFRVPAFDTFAIAITPQFSPRFGSLRPYVGGGPIVVSIGNDFVAFRPDVYAASPGSPDQFVFASWSQLDVGLEVVTGLDILLGTRFFPFVEGRYRIGEATFGPEDVKLGSLSAGGIGLDTSDLETVPDDPEVGGRPYEGSFDWSGPSVLVGLKIRF